MDVDKNDNVRASSGSSTSSGTVAENVPRCKQVKASAMDIVQALTSFIWIEKRGEGWRNKGVCRRQVPKWAILQEPEWGDQVSEQNWV